MEQSEESTKDAKLLYEATNLTNNYSNDLDNLKSEVKAMTSFYAVTPQGKLARELKKNARRINEVNGLHVYKLPTKMIHEVFFTSILDIVVTVMLHCYFMLDITRSI